MRQLEPDVVRLVLEGGGDLIVLDFIVLVVGERGPEADLLDPGDRVTVLAANVDAVAAQIHERHLVMPMIVIVIVIAVMAPAMQRRAVRSEEHTSELQSRENLVCRLLLEKK